MSTLLAMTASIADRFGSDEPTGESVLSEPVIDTKPVAAEVQLEVNPTLACLPGEPDGIGGTGCPSRR